MTDAPLATDRIPLSAARVIAAASDIADREGIDAVTLTRVAKELGTSQPALYRHVDSFEGLIRALGLRGREILATRLTESAVGMAREDAVRAMGVAWRDMVHEHPGLYASTDRYPCAGDTAVEAAVDNIVATLARALVGFDLTDDEQVHVARSLRSAFHGFSHLESGDGHPREQDLDDSFDHLLELLCAGIRSVDGGSPAPVV